MPAARYERVLDGSDDKTDHSSTSARLTPDSDYESDTHHPLDELEQHQGYELQELNIRSRQEPYTLAGAAQHDEDDEDDDEDTYHGDTPARAPRRRRSSAHSFELYTPDEERKVRRKLDIRLVLFVALLYMMSFLDRMSCSCALQALAV